MSQITWKVERRKIADLNPAPYNPRRMTDKQRKDLGVSLSKFGMAEPVVINQNNTIIGGHQRVRILKERDGGAEIDVMVPSRALEPSEEKELNLRLNRNHGEFDLDLLAGFGEDILKDVGFDGKELDHIFESDPSEKDDDVPEEKETTEIKTGDLFQLGEHRVMCGNGIDKECVDILMRGDRSVVVHTDPPYNVDYGSSKNPRHKIKQIEGDKQSPQEWHDFCNDLFLIIKEFNLGDIYIWGAPGPEGMKMRLWLTEMGCHWSATIIWKKQQLVLSPANYQRMYEPCFYGWFGKSSFNADRKQTEVWEIDRPLNSKLYPTMKPVDLCERAIQNSSSREDIVLDLFGGSGSTLIACEKLNRKCRMMEIDPIYCQVIIDRWEKFTGLKSIKLI